MFVGGLPLIDRQSCFVHKDVCIDIFFFRVSECLIIVDNVISQCSFDKYD